MTSGPLLSVEQLKVSFTHDTKQQAVVDGVSFSIAAGETFALVGESGSGKSVTAHSILKLLPSHAVIGSESRIYLREQELLSLSEFQMNKVRGKKIGMIFQEPMTALNPLHTVEKQLGEVIGLHRGLRGETLHKEVLIQLERVQIAKAGEKLKAYPHQLSGGQRQRVMIAMALANEPELLIADEPTTALDVTVQKQIMLLLKRLQQEIKMGMLLITHDLGVVKHFADKVAVMQRGMIVEHGEGNQVLSHPKAQYTRELLNSEPNGIPVKSSQSNEEIMCAKDLSVRFPLSNPLFGKTNRFLVAIDNINLSLFRGKTLGLVGESGSGKSTLAMALLRLQSSTGSIRFKTQELQGMKQKALRGFRQKVQVVFQDPFASLSPRMTVQDIIAEGLRVHTKMSEGEIEITVLKAIDDVGLDRNFQHRYPHEFSGGQRQRVAIARALVLRPEVVFLDEPTSALDRAVQVQILNLLRDLQDKYQLTYVFISHDLKVIKSISHYIVVMKAGKIIEHGEAAEIFSNPLQPYTKELLSATLS
jgi:microcin C transport system ATP-binding protein